MHKRGDMKLDTIEEIASGTCPHLFKGGGIDSHYIQNKERVDTMAKAAQGGLLLEAFKACLAQLVSHRRVILDGCKAVHIHRVSGVAMRLHRPAADQKQRQVSALLNPLSQIKDFSHKQSMKADAQ